MRQQHFCVVPSEAVCGYDLSRNDFKRFYTETTNRFAHVTCPGCRKWIHDNRLSPGGFSDPEEWQPK